AGLRISEALDLRWRDIDLAAGRLSVRESKTDAGVRDVDLVRSCVRNYPSIRRRRGSRIWTTTYFLLRADAVGIAITLAGEPSPCPLRVPTRTLPKPAAIPCRKG